MIHEFRVKNFLSFKEEQILSFEATSDKSYQDLYCVTIKPNLKLLKLGIIYGANASGKTNLLFALNMLRKVVLKAKENKFEKIGFTPFLLNDTTQQEDGSFYLSFYIKKKRYIYTLVLNDDYIVSEKLIYYPKSQPALVFNRVFSKKEEVSKIEFGEKLAITNKEAIILEGNTINNSTLISIYNKSNVKIDLLENVATWFKMNLSQLITPTTDLTALTNKIVEESDTYKNFVIKALQKADFNISNILIEEENHHGLEEEKFLLKNISFVHDTALGKYAIPYYAQSSGTKRYYGLGGLMSLLMGSQRILPVDELETSLHFELINHFLKTFLVNSSNSQLLFSTHDIHILMADFIRRDVVWLCEKNEEGATALFSVSDFNLHKNISLFNAYRIGKLGAKPNTGDIYLELEPNGEKTKE